MAAQKRTDFLFWKRKKLTSQFNWMRDLFGRSWIFFCHGLKLQKIGFEKRENQSTHHTIYRTDATRNVFWWRVAHRRSISIQNMKFICDLHSAGLFSSINLIFKKRQLMTPSSPSSPQRPMNEWINDWMHKKNRRIINSLNIKLESILLN